MIKSYSQQDVEDCAKEALTSFFNYINELLEKEEK